MHKPRLDLPVASGSKEAVSDGDYEMAVLLLEGAVSDHPRVHEGLHEALYLLLPRLETRHVALPELLHLIPELGSDSDGHDHEAAGPLGRLDRLGGGGDEGHDELSEVLAES